MWRERISGFLFPAAEKDDGFRAEIRRVSVHGLLLAGSVQIAISLFLMAARLVVEPASATLPLRLQQAGLIIVLGLGNIALSRWPPMARWARLQGLISAFLVAATLIWASLLIASRSTNPNDFIPGQITLVMLIAVTTIPLKPIHTLLLGFAVLGAYIVAAIAAEQSLMEGLGPDDNYEVFIVMLTFLCSAISGVLYNQRVYSYQVLQQTVEAAEALRQAQTRILMSESAASLSRLAAAVSHEMNNPLGALLSGVDTLLLLASKQATATAQEQGRLVKLQSEVRRSVHDSVGRLRELIARMQRFTNLDQAEFQAADLNELLEDVAALVDPELKKSVAVELHLEPVPHVLCRPQQLSVAFSNLVHNAMKAVNGDGRIVITTRQVVSEVEIYIEDNGTGVDPEDLTDIFDPGFRVSKGRIASANWSMFNSRQIVREHGGDIRIASRQGQGTRITVTLPIADPAAADWLEQPA